jgi:hypothetical protein
MSEFDASGSESLKETARTAWTLGLVAIILAVCASCSSGMTAIGALPLGLMATMRARTVLASADLDPVSEVYAKTANITGLVALLFSLLYITVIGGIILLYGGLIVAMVAAGNL